MSDARRRRIARFIVAEAFAAGITLGTDGTELLCLTPLHMPTDTGAKFTSAIGAYREEIIALLHHGGAAWPTN